MSINTKKLASMYNLTYNTNVLSHNIYLRKQNDNDTYTWSHINNVNSVDDKNGNTYPSFGKLELSSGDNRCRFEHDILLKDLLQFEVPEEIDEIIIGEGDSSMTIKYYEDIKRFDDESDDLLKYDIVIHKNTLINIKVNSTFSHNIFKINDISEVSDDGSNVNDSYSYKSLVGFTDKKILVNKIKIDKTYMIDSIGTTPMSTWIDLGVDFGDKRIYINNIFNSSKQLVEGNTYIVLSYDNNKIDKIKDVTNRIGVKDITRGLKFCENDKNNEYKIVDFGNTSVGNWLELGANTTEILTENKTYMISNLGEPEFDFSTIDHKKYLKSIDINEGGSNYSIGDLITIVQGVNKTGFIKVTNVDNLGSVTEVEIIEGGEYTIGNITIEDRYTNINSANGLSFNSLTEENIHNTINPVVGEIFVCKVDTSIGNAKVIELESTFNSETKGEFLYQVGNGQVVKVDDSDNYCDASYIVGGSTLVGKEFVYIGGVNISSVSSVSKTLVLIPKDEINIIFTVDTDLTQDNISSLTTTGLVREITNPDNDIMISTLLYEITPNTINPHKIIQEDGKNVLKGDSWFLPYSNEFEVSELLRDSERSHDEHISRLKGAVDTYKQLEKSLKNEIDRHYETDRTKLTKFSGDKTKTLTVAEKELVNIYFAKIIYNGSVSIPSDFILEDYESIVLKTTFEKEGDTGKTIDIKIIYSKVPGTTTIQADEIYNVESGQDLNIGDVLVCKSIEGISGSIESGPNIKIIKTGYKITNHIFEQARDLYFDYENEGLNVPECDNECAISKAGAIALGIFLVWWAFAPSQVLVAKSMGVRALALLIPVFLNLPRYAYNFEYELHNHYFSKQKDHRTTPFMKTKDVHATEDILYDRHFTNPYPDTELGNLYIAIMNVGDSDLEFTAFKSKLLNQRLIEDYSYFGCGDISEMFEFVSPYGIPYPTQPGQSIYYELVDVQPISVSEIEGTKKYIITEFGNTDWNDLAGTSGQTYNIGDEFTAINDGDLDTTSGMVEEVILTFTFENYDVGDIEFDVCQKDILTNKIRKFAYANLTTEETNTNLFAVSFQIPYYVQIVNIENSQDKNRPDNNDYIMHDIRFNDEYGRFNNWMKELKKLLKEEYNPLHKCCSYTTIEEDNMQYYKVEINIKHWKPTGVDEYTDKLKTQLVRFKNDYDFIKLKTFYLQYKTNCTDDFNNKFNTNIVNKIIKNAIPNDNLYANLYEIDGNVDRDVQISEIKTGKEFMGVQGHFLKIDTDNIQEDLHIKQIYKDEYYRISFNKYIKDDAININSISTAGDIGTAFTYNHYIWHLLGVDDNYFVSKQFKDDIDYDIVFKAKIDGITLFRNVNESDVDENDENPIVIFNREVRVDYINVDDIVKNYHCENMKDWSNQIIHHEDPYFQIGSSYSNGYVISTDQKNLCALDGLQNTSGFATFFLNIIDTIRATSLGLIDNFDPGKDPEDDTPARERRMEGVDDETSCEGSVGNPHTIKKHFNLLTPYFKKSHRYRDFDFYTGDYDKYTTNLLNKQTEAGTHANMRLRKNPVYKTHECNKQIDSFKEYHVDLHNKWRSHIKYNQILTNLKYSKEHTNNSVEKFEYVRCNSKSNIFKEGKIQNIQDLEFTISSQDGTSDLPPNTFLITILHSTSLKLKLIIKRENSGNIYKINDNNVNLINVLSEGTGILSESTDITYLKNDFTFKNNEDKEKYTIQCNNNIIIDDIQFKESFSNLKILYNTVLPGNNTFKMTKIKKIIKSDTITYFSQKFINQINNNQGKIGGQIIDKLTINECNNNTTQEINNINWDLNNLYLRVFPIKESLSTHYINDIFSDPIKKIPRLSTKHIIKTTNLISPQIYNKFLFTYFKSDIFNIEININGPNTIQEIIDESRLDYLSLKPPPNYTFTTINNINSNTVLTNVRGDENYLKYILLNIDNNTSKYITINGDTSETKFYITKLNQQFITLLQQDFPHLSSTYTYHYLLNINSNKQFLQIYNNLSNQLNQEPTITFIEDYSSNIIESYSSGNIPVDGLTKNPDSTTELIDMYIQLSNQINVFNSDIFIDENVLTQQYTTILNNINEAITYFMSKGFDISNFESLKGDLTDKYNIKKNNLYLVLDDDDDGIIGQQRDIPLDVTDAGVTDPSVTDPSVTDAGVTDAGVTDPSDPQTTMLGKQQKNMMLYIIIGSVALVLIISLLIYFRSRIFK